MTFKKSGSWIRAFMLALLACGTAMVAHAHNVYTSFSRIDWNASDGSIEVILQIHAHELETKLSLMADERLSFLEDADLPALEAAAAPLMARMIALEIDGTPVPLGYLGLETDNQNVLLYLEADWPTAPTQLRFMNALFLEDLPDQVNSVLVVVKGERRGGDITAESGPIIVDF